MKITRKTEKLTLSTFISLWSKVYMRSRQFYRYYQAIGLFTIVSPTFAPDSVKAILLKVNPVSNIFYFSCSKTVLRKYLTGNTSDKKIQSPIKNSRNAYSSSVSIHDLEGFDTVSSTMLFLDENFYMPDEVIEAQKAKLQLWANLNNSLTNNSLITVKVLRQILVKALLHSLFKR